MGKGTKEMLNFYTLRYRKHDIVLQKKHLPNDLPKVLKFGKVEVPDAE